MDETQLARDRKALNDNLMVKLTKKTHKITLDSVKPTFSAYDFNLLKGQYAYDDFNTIKTGLDERYSGHGDIDEAKKLAGIPKGFRPSKRSIALREVATKMSTNQPVHYQPVEHVKPPSDKHYMNGTQVYKYAQKRLNSIDDKVRSMFMHHSSYNNAKALGLQRGDWQNAEDYARKHPNMRMKAEDVKSGHITNIAQEQDLDTMWDNVTGNKRIPQLDTNTFKGYLHNAKSFVKNQSSQLKHVSNKQRRQMRRLNLNQHKRSHTIHHGPSHDGPTLE